jgi:DNA-binding winged helix-turn-helix (wHTH) protein/Tol biopolymer transport system component
VAEIVYEFGEYRLDCGRFELLRNGKALRVERKPMELLILLASRQGQLVMRAEIAERMWSSEVFVDTEHGINTAVRKLRHLLRDDADEPNFIQTVTGMGYRFVAPVSVLAASTAAPAQPVDVTPVPAPAANSQTPPPPRRALGWYVAAGTCALVAFGGTAVYRSRQHPPEIKYTQLTDFTDSAVQPALSPDGHMMAFIRGGETFLTSDQIYVKMLPNGDARRITDDNRPKYGLAFSPDGSEIAYTALEGSFFSTYEVSVLGGEPRLLLHNAAGLVWLHPERLLYSQAPSGIHLGVVTSTATRADLQQIYSPTHERGMAHYSFPSPDRRWALIVEMNGNGDWAPCRLAALQGLHETRTVGPTGACTSAGWSPDGHWMYFTAAVKDRSHVWEQRFPQGEPEQLTFGPTEEDGIAVEPEGRALITSVGVHESSIWIHDTSGQRSLSSEGEVLWWPTPVFNSDGSIIYYLLRRRESSGVELWRTMVNSGNSEAVFPGISMTAFDLSPDGKEVVYTTGGMDGKTELWLAPLDRSSPATKANISDVRDPRFGGHGQILFQHAEGSANYLEQIEPDGTKLSKVIPYPISDFQGISPGRRWATVGVLRSARDNSAGVMIAPVDGGPLRRVCVGYCQPKWSIDGRLLFIPVEDASRTSPGRSLAVPVGPGETLPDLPAAGIPAGAEPGVVRGAQSVGRAGLVPGRDPEHYAWVNTTVHRNLYRISIP